jgi:hypothetical protein
MFLECRHILPSGQKCKSPALRKRPFCYFHSHLRDRSDAPPPRPDTPFVLPSLEDSRGLLVAVMEVLKAMGQGRIKRSEAATYLYGLQIAGQLVARIEKSTSDPVRVLLYDNNALEMGEEKKACEPPRDCVNCDCQDICEARRIAESQKPEDIQEVIAKVRSMTPQQILADFEARHKARNERLQRIRELPDPELLDDDSLPDD